MQKQQVCVWETAKDDVRIFGCCPTVVGALCSGFGGGRIQVLEAGGFCRGVAPPCHGFQKNLETYILVHGDDFFIVGRREGAKACAGFAARCIRAEQSCDSGPRIVAVTDSELLGKNTDIATMGIEYEPDQQHVSRALKALGLTDAEGVATPGTDDVVGPRPAKSVSCAERQNGLCEKWLRRVHKTSPPSRELRDTQSNTRG